VVQPSDNLLRCKVVVEEKGVVSTRELPVEVRTSCFKGMIFEAVGDMVEGEGDGARELLHGDVLDS
jgi:hypothetical protein